MQAVDFGALLFSALVEVFSLPPPCPIKDWRYSQAAGKLQVCDYIRRFLCLLCVVGTILREEGEGKFKGMCCVQVGALRAAFAHR
jgi:hypothetical protein